MTDKVGTFMEKLPTKVGVAIGDVGATYLRLPPGTTLAEWRRAAQRITAIGYGYWWWLADLAHFARHHFVGKDQQAAFTELSQAAGMRMSRLYQLAQVAQGYPVRERVPGISITHHLYVMHLPKARRMALLRSAARRGWPLRVLSEHAVSKEERMVSVMLKVPAVVAREKKFTKGLAAFADQWTAHYFVWGTVRPRKTLQQRKPTR